MLDVATPPARRTQFVVGAILATSVTTALFVAPAGAAFRAAATKCADPSGTVKKGIEALGTSFVSSYTYGGATRFAKGHYDGVSIVQVLEYDPAAKAWSFTSANQKAIPVP